jgi:hypothetical protein
MLPGETHLQMAERHVRDAEGRVARQRRAVEELARDGHTTRLAVELLVEFQRALRNHRDELALLKGRATPS